MFASASTSARAIPHRRHAASTYRSSKYRPVMLVQVEKVKQYTATPTMSPADSATSARKRRGSPKPSRNRAAASTHRASGAPWISADSIRSSAMRTTSSGSALRIVICSREIAVVWFSGFMAPGSVLHPNPIGASLIPGKLLELRDERRSRASAAVQRTSIGRRPAGCHHDRDGERVVVRGDELDAV